MVEHLLAKEKAAGSNPVFRSIPPIGNRGSIVRVANPRFIRCQSLDVGHDSLGSVGSDLALLFRERVVAGDPLQIVRMKFAHVI